MENIKHLIEVLKSQVTLYDELLELLSKEKECIVAWAISETIEINKKKEELLHKERIQEEARKALLSKIAAVACVPHMTLSMVINFATDEKQKDQLLELGDKLLALVTSIHTENLSLKILYNTNNRLVNEFFKEAGLVDNNSYSNSNRNISTYRGIA